MRTSPEVTEVSGTNREAQNRNTSPSNTSSGETISTGGNLSPSGETIWFSSISHRWGTFSRTSQMPMESMTSPPSSCSPMRRVLPTSPSASRFTRTRSLRRRGGSSSSCRGWARFTARTRPAAMAAASAGSVSGSSAVTRVDTPSSAVSRDGAVTGKVSRPAPGVR